MHWNLESVAAYFIIIWAAPLSCPSMLCVCVCVCVCVPTELESRTFNLIVHVDALYLLQENNLLNIDSFFEHVLEHTCLSVRVCVCVYGSVICVHVRMCVRHSPLNHNNDANNDTRGNYVSAQGREGGRGHPGGERESGGRWRGEDWGGGGRGGELSAGVRRERPSRD